jgi:hypothetical protein
MTNLKIIGLLLVVISGCTIPVEIETPQPEQKPVIICFFTPTEPFVLHLTHSANQTDTTTNIIDNALVTLSTNEDFYTQLPHQSNGYYTDTTIYPKSGIMYNLTVEIPGLPTLSASDSIPAAVSTFSFIKYTEKRWFTEGSEYSGLTFEIDENPGTNYYEILYRVSYHHPFYDELTPRFKIGHFRTIGLADDDIIWQSLFTNTLFAGKKITIELADNNIEYFRSMDSLNYTVQILQESPSLYKYRHTLIKHLDAQYADFWEPIEPVIMYTNIDNGYGIFAGYQSQITPIIFPE